MNYVKFYVNSLHLKRSWKSCHIFLPSSRIKHPSVRQVSWFHRMIYYFENQAGAGQNHYSYLFKICANRKQTGLKSE